MRQADLLGEFERAFREAGLPLSQTQRRSARGRG